MLKFQAEITPVPAASKLESVVKFMRDTRKDLRSMNELLYRREYGWASMEGP